MEETDSGDRRYQDPENQLQPLREWCKVQGWDIYKEYVDRSSGADPSRPEFRNMINDAMQMKFQAIAIWRLDRFSRSGISFMLSHIEKLRGRGVGIKSLTETWFDTSTDNPISELLIAVFSWVAKEERRKISERTKAGIQRLKNIGQWKGGRPKGVKDSKPRKTKPSYEQHLKEERKKGRSESALLDAPN